MTRDHKGNEWSTAKHGPREEAQIRGLQGQRSVGARKAEQQSHQQNKTKQSPEEPQFGF